jgi:hypothetical protein
LSRDREWLVQFSSIPLVFSYFVRPTNLLSLVLLTFFVFTRYRKYFLRYVLLAGIIAAPFLIHNILVYHSPLSQYYQGRYQQFGIWPEGLVGNIISPSRGLMVFTPVLLFSVYGAYLKFKAKKFELLDLILISIILLHWLIISSNVGGWAGWSFGPRYFSDMLPYFMYFMTPALVMMRSLEGHKKTSLTVLFAVLMLISFFIHYRGANDWSTAEWNSNPVSIDNQPSRVWNISDIQFLRGFKQQYLPYFLDYKSDLDIGGDDELYIQNFNVKEKALDNTTFRWTKDASTIRLKVQGASKSYKIQIRMATVLGYNLTSGVGAINLLVGNQVVATGVPLGKDFAIYTFNVSKEIISGKDTVDITIQTKAWQPSVMLGTEDGRYLGVIVDWINLTKAN